MMQPVNRERYERLRALAPLEAVRAWINGEFGIGDEPAMIFAIRKDPRISISDEAIEDILMDATEDGLDAAVCLERLAASR
jgi:hypothetical protein